MFQGLSKKFNRWKALIKINGKRKEIASFADEAEAARCYDRHATLAWGARYRTLPNPNPTLLVPARTLPYLPPLLSLLVPLPLLQPRGSLACCCSPAGTGAGAAASARLRRPGTWSSSRSHT